MTYSFEPTDRLFVKSYGFVSFTKNMVRKPVKLICKAQIRQENLLIKLKISYKCI